jgi:hypothetical protein
MKNLFLTQYPINYNIKINGLENIFNFVFSLQSFFPDIIRDY